MWVGMIIPTFSRLLKGRCYGNRFLARIGNNLHTSVTSPSSHALAFHSGWEDRDNNASVNTADDPSASDENLVNYMPSNH